MNNVIHRITLDLEEQASREYVSVRKNDTAHVVSVGFRVGGIPYEIGENTSATCVLVSVFGSTYITATATVNGNRVEVTIPSEATAAVDSFACVIALEENTVLYSPPFTINVYDQPSQT